MDFPTETPYKEIWVDPSTQ